MPHHFSSLPGLRRVRIFLALALLGLSASAAWAEGTISIEPVQPTENDLVTITFDESSWAVPCDPYLGSVQVVGNDILIKVEPPGGCILILGSNPYTVIVDIGPLPAGQYDVIVDAPIQDGYGQAVTTSEFVVGEGGQSQLFEPASLNCVSEGRPAATLLLPYFEVDLDDPLGSTTLLAIGNASALPTLAHLVVWTNSGVPVLSFDVAIAGRGVRWINLLDTIGRGELPETPLHSGMASSFPGCSDPIETPVLDLAALTQLQTRLTGKPEANGVCFGHQIEEQLAVGYVTVDRVNDCSGSALRHPGDENYFEDGGTGLGSNDNILTGSYYYMAQSENSAQGIELIRVLADADRFGSEAPIDFTFYGQGTDNRAPLGSRYQTDYLWTGGVGETELILWAQGPAETGHSCGTDAGEHVVAATFRNAAGELDSQHVLFGSLRTRRLMIGGEPWPVGSRFGTADISFLSLGFPEQYPANPDQGVVVPIASAAGRFSVGLNATQVTGFCP